MKLFLIEPYRKDFNGNGLFNPKIDPNLIVFKKIRKYLLSKNILFDTIDLHDIKKADKIFFIDYGPTGVLSNHYQGYYLKKCLVQNIPKDKLNLIIWECPIIKPGNWKKQNHSYYSKVFTWNDSLVDNKKYYRFHWPQSEIIKPVKPYPFNKKKFMVLINAFKTNYFPDELYSLRIKAIRFFERRVGENFDLYGPGWNKPLSFKYLFSVVKGKPLKIGDYLTDFLGGLQGFPSYRGTISDKLTAMRKYKYAICFENMKNIDGYITEKIFDSFKAKCVPVYFGAKNITRYIPKNLFIDFRDFRNFEDLYQYLTQITEKEYGRYIERIEAFLKSPAINQCLYRSFAKDVFLKSLD